ncbi:ribonuclease T2 family protein [Sphingomonas sp.]|uniref:ribonuclease T2 family protein n=1 Tax=Sphingomonas sp. TaxID=28214 RepID=UPI003B3AC166
MEPIGGYTLALIWAPEHCARPVPGAESFQCGPIGRGGFVLHGLWPDGQGKSWPQWCTDAAILPPGIITTYHAATPSAQLMQHEWAKHGTCMGITPKAYFKRSSRLFYRIRFPDMVTLAGQTMDAGSFTRAFAAANPGMTSDMVTLNLDRDGWLREVWLCLDTKFRRERCRTPTRGNRIVRIRLPGAAAAA